MILVRIDRIKGDVKIPGYDSWFIATSMDFGVGRKVEASSTNATTGGKVVDVQIGKAESQELSIDKSVDSATVYLMQAAMKSRSDGGKSYLVSIDIHLIQNKSYDEAIDSKSPVKPYLKIRIENAIVQSWKISADDDQRPSESISIWFNRAAIKYRASPDGKVYQTFGPLGWDQQKNEEWKSDQLTKNDD